MSNLDDSTWTTVAQRPSPIGPNGQEVLFCLVFLKLYFNQVCCNGLTYSKKPHHYCCEGKYLSWSNSSNPVCCSGKLLPALPDYHCCGGYYVHVKSSRFQSCLFLHTIREFLCEICPFPCLVFPSSVLVFVDEYCCPDQSWGRVSVGPGDSCCGGVPYAVSGGQLCCSGSLRDGYGVQCCGGQIVEETLMCCGDADSGEVHTHVPGEGRIPTSTN